METGTLVARSRKITRQNARKSDKGRAATERPPPVKTRRCVPSQCIFPNLLASRHDVSKDLDHGVKLLPDIPPLDERRFQRSSSGAIEDCIRVDSGVGESLLDGDDHSSVDIDDLISIDSDDLESLLGGSGGCSSAWTISHPGHHVDQTSIDGCERSDYKPGASSERAITDGEDAYAGPVCKSRSSVEEVLFDADVPASYSPPCTRLGRKLGAADHADCKMVGQDARDIESCRSSGIQAAGPDEHNEREHSLDVSTASSWVMLKSSPAQYGPLPATQEESMSALKIPMFLDPGFDKWDSKKAEASSARAHGGNFHGTEPASTCSRLLEISGVQPTGRRKPTVFEEQYTKYQRIGKRKEAESPKRPVYEGHPEKQGSILTVAGRSAPVGIFRNPSLSSQSAFGPETEIGDSWHPSRSQVRENPTISFQEDTITKSEELIATEARTTPTKRQRSLPDLHVKPTSSDSCKMAEPLTPANSETFSAESSLKKAKLADSSQPNIVQADADIEVGEDAGNEGERDDDFVPTEHETSGSLKTLQPATGIIFPATPPSSDESRTPSPKKLILPASNRPKGSPRKSGRSPKAKSPKAAADGATPSVGTILRLPSYGKPLVWAEGRQALCETLSYYRAYQSGAYTHDNLSYGFLLDKDCGERAFMDEEIVITRAGGGCKKNEDGEMEQADDQSSSSSTVKNFLNNKKYGVPVALIVGKQNSHCPSNIPHAYCVMDWFQVTDVWPEKSNGKKCFKFRFEKLDLATKSWWAAEGTPDPPAVRDFSIKAIRKTCTACDEQSPQVFQQGWMCLNEDCLEFWMIDGLEAPAELTYNNYFVRERTEWPKQIKPPYNLKPALLETDMGNDAGYAVSRVCWKGIACPNCGRCNSREYWNEWNCQTENCGFTYKVKQSVLSPRAVLGAHDVEFNGHALPQDTFTWPVTEQTAFMDNWRLHTFDILPGNVVTHFLANSTINKRAGGPHDMFLALQDVDIGLQRFALKISGLKGPTLTNHFAVNFGMPYKYVVDVDSKPFAEAPMPIINALHRLTWAGQKTVNNGTFQPFNELLTLGYFEQQKIGFHDDGESTLGPTIATLSLGGQAKMMIRMKAAYYSGKTKAGKYDPQAPVLPGCKGYKERIKLNSLYGKVSNDAFEKEKIATYKKIGRIGNPPILLTMQLNHGDMVVMHGAEMQKYYEHSVIPSDKLRFALTCRYVRPELVDASQHWKGDHTAELGAVYDGDEAFAYDAATPALEAADDFVMVDLPVSGEI